MTCENLSEFIDKERIKMAKTLLEKGDVKIGDIGQKVGYENPGSFSRFFKKSMHMTPQEYIDEIVMNNKHCIR